MPNNKESIAATTGGEQRPGGDAMQRARSATESIAGVARDAAERFDDTWTSAADGLARAASGIRDSADDLPGARRVKTLTHAAADRLSAGASYVRTHDAKRMVADVESFVKSNPGLALAIAAAFGVLVGRALSRD